MNIRKAKLNDAPAIVDLWEEFMQVHDEKVLETEPKFKSQIKKKTIGKKLFRKFVEEKISSEDSGITVAEDKGELVAYSLFYISENIPVFEIEKLGKIGDLYVKKEYQGKGISTKFKDEAIKFFRKKGIKHLSLMVFPTNEHAHNIYKKWGFFDYHIEMRKEL